VVPGFDAAGAECGGEALRALLELAEGTPILLERERRGVGGAPRRAGDQLGHGEPARALET